MGTNYYYKYNECEECGRHDEMHVGKSSIGWKFQFHAGAFRDLGDWKVELSVRKIYDEYGKDITLEEFIELVEAKKDVDEPYVDYSHSWSHPPIFVNGYKFFEGEFC
jgi:hypothetical protein